MRCTGGGLGNERGSTVVLMSVVLFGMLALGALAVDLASLRSARSEAQRAADAIALAGASAFRDKPANDPLVVQEARDRALELARLQVVRSDTLDVRNPAPTVNTYGWGQVTTIQTNQVTLNIIPLADSQKVRVWVRHAGIGTFFGGMLAKPYGHVQAMATAWAGNSAPVVNCLKPFLIPDMWHESQQDVNNNGYMEPEATAKGNQTSGGEQWFYQPSNGDYYAKYDPSVTNPPQPQTGYGSDARAGLGYSGDVGLPMLIKPQTGNNQRQGNFYFTLDGPASNLRNDIENECITAGVGDTPNFEKGGKTGQAKQGIQTLISRDPGATWNQSTRQVENSAFSDWTQSPRVILVGLMDPIYILGDNTNDKPNPGATFNNFARMFLQDTPGNTNNIQAIFLGFAPGGAGGPQPGTLVKLLQLIE